MKYTLAFLALLLASLVSCTRSSTTTTPANFWKFRNTTYSNNKIQRSGGGFIIEDSSTGAMQRLSLVFRSNNIPTTNTSLQLWTELFVAVAPNNDSAIYATQASNTNIATIVVNNSKLSVSIPQTWLYSNTFDSATGNFIADSALFSCNIQEP